MPKHPPFQTPAVAAKFAAYPAGARRRLMGLRQCIFETAAKLPGVGDIDTFRTLFPTDFEFEGNRALVFALDHPPPQKALAFCIAATLTYHQKKS